MPHTIFFSWQSDTPARNGLELVEEALGLAIAALAEDAEIERAIRDEGLMVDRDTQGVPGVPPIVDTIFNKIDAATIFVPDLTFVGKRIDRRPTPNPNVLVEYGWALKALSYTRIVPVMNMAFGEPTTATMPACQAAILHKCWPYPRTTEEGIELIDRDITDSEQANQAFVDRVFHRRPCLPIGLAQPTRP